jgi:hypothetical protein
LELAKAVWRAAKAMECRRTEGGKAGDWGIEALWGAKDCARIVESVRTGLRGSTADAAMAKEWRRTEPRSAGDLGIEALRSARDRRREAECDHTREGVATGLRLRECVAVGANGLESVKKNVSLCAGHAW